MGIMVVVTVVVGVVVGVVVLVSETEPLGGGAVGAGGIGVVEVQYVQS
jgi:hypothetical protein